MQVNIIDMNEVSLINTTWNRQNQFFVPLYQTGYSLSDCNYMFWQKTMLVIPHLVCVLNVDYVWMPREIVVWPLLASFLKKIWKQVRKHLAKWDRCFSSDIGRKMILVCLGQIGRLHFFSNHITEPVKFLCEII